MALPLEERWVTAEPEDMVEWFVDISRERMAMIADDLGGLPHEPMTLVEGPQLLPELLPAGARAIFLLSTMEFRERAIEARPFHLPVSDPNRAQRNRLERDRLVAERIRLGAGERDLPVIEVDGSRDADEVSSLVKPALHPFEPARDVAAVRRWENLAIARQLRLWAASGEGPHEAPEHQFACECGRVGCRKTLELSVPRFAALVASGETVMAHG